MKLRNRKLEMVMIGCVLIVISAAGRKLLAAQSDDQAISDFLHANFDHRNAGMVVGIVDERGTRFFAAGKLGNGDDATVDEDTLFEIGSVTKTFTALLLLDMVERGEVKLDDPVAKYLPDSVKMPTHGGKEVTLGNLAAQDSGLPFNASNHTGVDWATRFCTYTVEKMYAFLSDYKLEQDPGEKYQYSNIGMGLLSHVLALKSGRDFESLVKDHICKPLAMESTCIAIAPESKSRFAVGHDERGNVSDYFDLPAIPGAGALRSTARDLTKYASAQLGLTHSGLSPAIEKSHDVLHDDAAVPGMEGVTGRSAMPWLDENVWQPPDTKLLGHAGGTAGFNSFVGFDLQNHRGVVVLTNQMSIHARSLGWRILQRARLNGFDPQKMMPLREIIGAGLALDIDSPKGMLRISKVLANSPAEKAGLTAGRVICSIDGMPTTDKSIAQCAALIRGQSGTRLKLELASAGQNPTESIEMLREKFLVDD